MEHQVYCTCVASPSCGCLWISLYLFVLPAPVAARGDYRPPSAKPLRMWPALRRYDPEAFPGLTYRMTTPYDVVILVFHSGKVVLTKGKTREQVHGAFERMYPVLERFKDRTPAASAGK